METSTIQQEAERDFAQMSTASTVLGAGVLTLAFLLSQQHVDCVAPSGGLELSSFAVGSTGGTTYNAAEDLDDELTARMLRVAEALAHQEDLPSDVRALLYKNKAALYL